MVLNSIVQDANGQVSNQVIEKLKLVITHLTFT